MEFDDNTIRVQDALKLLDSGKPFDVTVVKFNSNPNAKGNGEVRQFRQAFVKSHKTNANTERGKNQGDKARSLTRTLHFRDSLGSMQSRTIRWPLIVKLNHQSVL